MFALSTLHSLRLFSFLHLTFCVSLLYFHNRQHLFQPISLFCEIHRLVIHHTFERLSVKHCPAMSWSAWTGNELAFNLALTLNQVKVIKRNMNCDASEKWQTTSETIDWSCWVFCQMLHVEIVFLLMCEQHRKMGAIEEIGLDDTGREKECNNPQYFINCSPLSYYSVFPEVSSSWRAK